MITFATANNESSLLEMRSSFEIKIQTEEIKAEYKLGQSLNNRAIGNSKL